jgi:hypothetical protein
MKTPPPSFTDNKSDTAKAMQILQETLKDFNQTTARMIMISARRHRISLEDLEQAALATLEEANYPTWHEVLRRTDAYHRPAQWNPNQKPPAGHE